MNQLGAAVVGGVFICVSEGFHWKWRKKGQFRGSDGRRSEEWSEEVYSTMVRCCWTKLCPPLLLVSTSVDQDGLIQRRRELLFPATAAARRNNLKLGGGEGAGRRGISLPTTNPPFPSFPPRLLFWKPIVSFGINDGEGAGASRRGAHREPGRGGEAFVREATVHRRLVWDRWRRQQRRPRRLLTPALQPAQVGLWEETEADFLNKYKPMRNARNVPVRHDLITVGIYSTSDMLSVKQCSVCQTNSTWTRAAQEHRHVSLLAHSFCVPQYLFTLRTWNQTQSQGLTA